MAAWAGGRCQSQAGRVTRQGAAEMRQGMHYFLQLTLHAQNIQFMVRSSVVNQKGVEQYMAQLGVEQADTTDRSNDEIPGPQALPQKKVAGHRALQG